MENPSQIYEASSPAIWDRTVLPAARLRWTRPALSLDKQAGTRFTYPAGIESWVDLHLNKSAQIQDVFATVSLLKMKNNEKRKLIIRVKE